jgi:hypothetical protein
MQPLRVFIGWDSREPIAFHVAAHSILRRASKPVAIIPLVQDQLRSAGLYTRERGATEATEFSMTRFLVPYLSGYEGFSIFMDCDVLCKADIHEMVDLERWPIDAAVQVCQHHYTPKDAIKMDGCAQTTYPCKNWSSVMAFDNGLCRALTPDYVNTASGVELHRFSWLYQGEIGSLPLGWNWLVGEYPANPDAKILHYTNGGPWFRDYHACDHAKDWLEEYRAMRTPPFASFSKDAWVNAQAAALPCG